MLRVEVSSWATACAGRRSGALRNVLVRGVVDGGEGFARSRAFLQQNSAAGVGRRAFSWIATMRGPRWRLRHSRWAFTRWLETEQRRWTTERDARAKLALVVRRLMFGNLARIFAGWRLIPSVTSAPSASSRL